MVHIPLVEWKLDTWVRVLSLLVDKFAQFASSIYNLPSIENTSGWPKGNSSITLLFK